MEVELPFKAEYAKTGRAKCKGCKNPIGQSELRLAAMVQSAFHDGKQPNWFHEYCFFKKQRPTSVGDIEHFESLRFEDQERVKKQVDEVSTVVLPKSGKKRTNTETAALKDFGIEYAKSGRAECRGCEQKILKDQVRIRKTVFDTEVGMKYGGQPLWHHIECFAQMRQELGWLGSGEDLPGFKSLKQNDRADVKKALPVLKAEDAAVSAAKKAKLEPKDEQDVKAEKATADLIKKQTDRLFFFRDAVKANLRKEDIHQILHHNEQEPISDSEKLLDQIADLLTFGAIAACKECKGHQMLFHKSGYLCNGQLTEWTKCSNVEKEPVRTPCLIPKGDWTKTYPFLKKVSKKTEVRAIRYIPPSTTTIAKSVSLKKGDEVDGPKVKREVPPLYNYQFVQIGLKDEEKSIKARLMKLGAKLDSKVTEKAMAIFSTKEEIKNNSRRFTKAKELGIQVIPYPDYLDAVEAQADKAVNYISSMSLCDWGTDPSVRLPQKEEQKSGKSKSIYTKSVAKSVTLKIKDGMAVDPESGLADVAHVYTKKEDKYSVVLGLTDIQRNKNSYYKLQLLEDAKRNNYWIFRAWGRIGTTIGDNKLEKFDSLMSAIQNFKSVYLDKTGNHFENRQDFVKVPGRMYPIDVDYEDEKLPKYEQHDVKSKLDPALQSLVKLIFDIETMKSTMMSFQLDMEKMPLGKLSQKQLQSAYKVLTELYNLIDSKGSNSQFIDATNRFYTLIPHNFGIGTPPLIDTLEQIENLRQMLDSLLEIECAYSLLKTEIDNPDLNPLDKHYEQLKTKLEPLDKKSDEFIQLQNYVNNTHAETHRMYELEVVDIFKVARQGEARRFKPFKKLHNRKLLWHGSRLTNFAGILSHGLKIAPPEAPVTGYMFGKGIYFADMVSKSANYCCTTQQNNTGLLLLSEVALGNMMECTSAKYVKKLPSDKHSCYGRGRTMPNPKESIMRDDGVEIPLGKAITDSTLTSSLLYNEFIVYDIAQVNIQYLLRINFNYKV